MKQGVQITPPITRVHNIFRIRTIVNAITRMNKQKIFPNDKEIAKVLAESGLSKLRKERIKDRIMRRARDHLLTASYMGLLTRQGRPFQYSTTTSGIMLERYGKEECPKDTLEEAIFIDKLMRLKLTNVFDAQSGKQYTGFRSRPCLFILHLLEQIGPMHEHHLAVGTGGSKCDPFLQNKETLNIIKIVKKYQRLSLQIFYRDFLINTTDRKNITRNIRPLLDWLHSVGLIEHDAENADNRIYKISRRGKSILKFYSKMMPLWYYDFKELADIKSALLLFYTYVKKLELALNKSLIESSMQVGLHVFTIKEILEKIERETPVKFSDDYTTLETEIDFNFEYDIPPEKNEMCTNYLAQIFKIMHMKIDVKKFEQKNISEIEYIIQENTEQIRIQVKDKFSKSTHLTDEPTLAKITALMPTGGILNQYRSDFEKETSLLLRLLQFNAVKYQGQVAERTHKKHIMAFFENNPDILITNGIEILVECKSIGEWKMPIRDIKNVPKEILIYQQYLKEIKSQSVMVVYEGTLDEKSLSMISSILNDAKGIVFVTKNFLINCIQKPAEKKRLELAMRLPQRHTANQRIMH